MKQLEFHLFGDSSLPAMRLGESALWDERSQKFYWVDIDGCCVYRSDAEGKLVEKRVCDGRPGCVALTSDQELLLVGVEQTVMMLHWPTQSCSDFAHVGGKTAQVRLNDGKADRFGGFWVGSMHSPSSAGRFDGELFQIDSAGLVRKLKENIGVANGLAFTLDGKRGFFADSPSRLVLEFQFREGVLNSSTERVLFDFGVAGIEGKPDGACVDVDGCYWVACGYGASVARIDPLGRLDRVIPVPVKRPTCCAFGGPNLDKLLVTSIGTTDGIDLSKSQNDPWAGHVIVADLGYQGAPEGVFAL
jgi:sugar lactone lactonase YvrE